MRTALLSNFVRALVVEKNIITVESFPHKRIKKFLIMQEKNRSWEKTLERAAYNQLTRKLPLQMDLYFLVNSICVLRLKRKSSLFIISTIILALYTYSIFCLFRLIMCQFCARNDSREWHCKDLRRGAFKLFTPGANACDYCYFIRGECINWKENSIVSQIKMQSG